MSAINAVMVKTELDNTTDEVVNNDFYIDIKSEDVIKEEKFGYTDVTMMYNKGDIGGNNLTKTDDCVEDEANQNEIANISNDINNGKKSHSKQHGSRQKLNCKFCEKAFSDKRMLENHFLKSHPNENYEITSKLHRCELCTFITTVKKDKRRHIFKHHSQLINAKHIMQFNCTPDAENNEFDADIKHEHVEDEITIEHHDIENNKFDADIKYEHVEDEITIEHHDIDSKIVNDIDKIKEEMQGEIPVKKKKRYPCEYCDYQTDFRRTIKEHMSIHNKESAELFKCPKCNFTTYYKMGLHSHLKRHGERVKINCTFCNKAFYTKRVLHNHLLKYHPDEQYEITSKLHSCKLCTFKTTVKKEMARHLRNHSPDIHPKHCVTLAYNCSCHKTIRKHFYKCSHCAYQSDLVTEFRKHLGTHSISDK